MFTIGEAIGGLNVPPKMQAEADRAMEQAWKDRDVVEFISKHKDVIDQDVLDRGRTTILSFVQGKKDPRYKQELVMYAGNIYMHESPTETTASQMANEGIRTEQRYDSITRNFNNVTHYHEGDMGSIKAERFLANFVENYQYGAKQKGMWLHGQQGIGKTHLMGYFTTLLRMQNIGFTFVNSAQLHHDMRGVQANFGKYVNKNVWRYKKAEILIVDDIGAERPTKFMIDDILYQIMDYRMNKGLPTFFTSNYTIRDYEQQLEHSSELTKMIAERMQERLSTLSTEILMTGQNRRNKS